MQMSSFKFDFYVTMKKPKAKRSCNLIYFICVSWFFVQAMLEQRENETPAPMIFKKIPDYPNVQAVPD